MRPAKRAVGTVALAASLAAPVQAADLPEVKRRGVLRVILAGDPADASLRRSRFVTPQGDAIAGLEGEILVGFARLHGVRAELVYGRSWDGLVPALLKGAGDVVAGGFTDTAARRKRIDFTAETFPTRNVVVTRKPHRVVETVAQLREERVGVSRGTSYLEAVRAAGVPPENVDDSYQAPKLTAREALREGRVTAIVEGVELALTTDADDPAFQLGMFLGPPESLALGVRKEDALLRAALDEYISNVRRTPTWNRLVVKYFGEKALDILRRAREQ